MEIWMSVITRDLQEAIDTSLNNFLDRGLISEVLYMVRSGKEAIV